MTSIITVDAVECEPNPLHVGQQYNVRLALRDFERHRLSPGRINAYKQHRELDKERYVWIYVDTQQTLPTGRPLQLTLKRHIEKDREYYWLEHFSDMDATDGADLAARLAAVSLEAPPDDDAASVRREHLAQLAYHTGEIQRIIREMGHHV